MSLWSRILLLLRVRTTAALDRAEDPQQTLDYAYRQQQDLLRKVKQGLIEVATSKRQLEQQAQKLHLRVPQVEEQAGRALAAGREDLARIALQRKQTALAEIAGLSRQIAEVDEEERRLVLAEQQLAARIEEFRTHRSVLSARYTAAEAQVRINEALSGVSEEFAELGMAVGRAEERMQGMLARASAIDALIDSGRLVLPGGASDPVERELRELASNQAVERELALLKAQLGQDQQSPALESGN